MFLRPRRAAGMALDRRPVHREPVHRVAPVRKSAEHEILHCVLGPAHGRNTNHLLVNRS